MRIWSCPTDIAQAQADLRSGLVYAGSIDTVSDGFAPHSSRRGAAMREDFAAGRAQTKIISSPVIGSRYLGQRAESSRPVGQQAKKNVRIPRFDACEPPACWFVVCAGQTLSNKFGFRPSLAAPLSPAPGRGNTSSDFCVLADPGISERPFASPVTRRFRNRY